MAKIREELIERLKNGENAHQIARAAVGITDDTLLTRLRWQGRGGSKKTIDPRLEVQHVPTGLEVVHWENRYEHASPVSPETHPVVLGAIAREQATTKTFLRPVERTSLMAYVREVADVYEIVEPYVTAQAERVKDITRRTDRLEAYATKHGSEVKHGYHGTEIAWKEPHARLRLGLLAATEGTSAPLAKVEDVAYPRTWHELTKKYQEYQKYPGLLPQLDIAAEPGSLAWEAHLDALDEALEDPSRIVQKIPTVAAQIEFLNQAEPSVGTAAGTHKRIQEAVGQPAPTQSTVYDLLVWLWANASDLDITAPVLRGLGSAVARAGLRSSGEHQDKFFRLLRESQKAGPVTHVTLIP